MAEQKRAIKIFYSYAHEDREYQEKLEQQLVVFKNQGIISSWNDRDITAGKEFEQEIETSLNTADIILLLISPDFMASEYCYSKEMKRALERHENKEATVIPIILRPVHWQDAPFGKLQALPPEAKPVTTWQNLDEAFYTIAMGIIQTIIKPFLPQIASNNVALKLVDHEFKEFVNHKNRFIGFEHVFLLKGVQEHRLKLTYERVGNWLYLKLRYTLYLEDKVLLVHSRDFMYDRGNPIIFIANIAKQISIENTRVYFNVNSSKYSYNIEVKTASATIFETNGSYYRKITCSVRRMRVYDAGKQHPRLAILTIVGRECKILRVMG